MQRTNRAGQHAINSALTWKGEENIDAWDLGAFWSFGGLIEQIRLSIHFELPELRAREMTSKVLSSPHKNYGGPGGGGW